MAPRRLKPRRACPTCGAFLVPGAPHLDRCARATPEDREFYKRHDKWPTSSQGMRPRSQSASAADSAPALTLKTGQRIRLTYFEDIDEVILHGAVVLEYIDGVLALDYAGKRLVYDLRSHDFVRAEVLPEGHGQHTPDGRSVIDPGRPTR